MQETAVVISVIHDSLYPSLPQRCPGSNPWNAILEDHPGLFSWAFDVITVVVIRGIKWKIGLEKML